MVNRFLSLALTNSILTYPAKRDVKTDLSLNPHSNVKFVISESSLESESLLLSDAISTEILCIGPNSVFVVVVEKHKQQSTSLNTCTSVF